MKTILTAIAALYFLPCVAQNWQPFYPTERCFYTTDADYISDQLLGQVALPENSILGVQFESSETNQNGTTYYNHTIPNSGFDGECIDLIHWTGIVQNSGNEWMSITRFNDTIYWPTTIADTLHFMRIDADSTIVLFFNDQTISNGPLGLDSVRSYQTMLIVQGDEYPTHELSQLPVVVSKEQGLHTTPLPFCFPHQIIRTTKIAFENKGALNGFSMPGVYNYEVGDKLHYKTLLEEGLTGTTIPFERITRHEAFTVESASKDLIAGTVSYSLKREMWEETKVFTQNSTGGYDITNTDFNLVDTVTWDNSNLDDFFLTDLPRGLDTTSGLPANYINTSFEHIGNYRLTQNFNTTIHPEFDTCGVNFYPFTGGNSSSTGLSEPFGLYSHWSVEFSGFSEYSSVQKNLVYFVNNDTTYGEPLPPLSVEDFASTSSFRFYPNPSQGVVTIESNTPLKSATIYNHLGQPVRQLTMNNTLLQRMSVQDLPTGMYLFQIESETGVQQMKFLKQ